MAQGQKVRAGRVRLGFTGNPLVMNKDEDPLVAASDPHPSWLLRISDSAGMEVGSYGLWHPMDLISSETLKVMSIERETRDMDGASYVQRIREQIQQIVPEMPDDVFERLTSKQLLAIGIKAWQTPAETPPEKTDREADSANPPDGERGSDSSSRSPLGALDGATRN